MAASTRSRSLLFAIALGSLAVTVPAAWTPAHAQKPVTDKKKLAKQYVDAGLAAQAAGDYDQAIALYKKAYEQVPHPVLYFNIGQAQRLAGRDEEALDAYQKYVDADPNGPKAKEAKGFIAEIKPRVAKARAESAEKDRLAGEADAKRKAAEAAAAEADKRRLAAEAAKPKDRDAAAVPAGRGRKRLGLVIGGSGLVIAGAGAVFGVLAMSSWNEAKDLCDDDRTCSSDADAAKANDLAADTRLRGNVSTILLGIGGAAVVTGVILYLTAPSGSAHPAEHAFSLSPTGDGALATWSGQW
jgi:tetratricopeptide (TPR) repeat protein